MSRQIADRPSDSSEAHVPPSGVDAPKEVVEVEIVGPNPPLDTPENPRAGQDYQGVGVFPDQQETVISKQPAASGPSSSHHAPTPHPAATPAEIGKALEGARLEHFQLEEFVGGGGMGAVFRATDTKLDRTVALKVLSRDRTDPDTLRRFQNEAQSAARLDHENIARVYYVGEDGGLHFIVFEFIEGINIRDLVETTGPLPIAEAVNYVLQVAEALEHASQRSVVHRDIKPSNVLITAEGRAKLVDMGLARLRHLESETGDLTASGVTLGTFDYISPEQARDPRIADVRSDLYSLGCTFYFMLTGKPPFPEGTVLQKLLSHSSEEPSDPRHVRPDLDEQVVRIINKLLAKQPADRHQQPSELIGELLLLADRLGLTGIARSGTVWTTSRKSLLARAERVLPWLLPILALPVSIIALERMWEQPTPGNIAESQPDLLAPVEPVNTPAAKPKPEPETVPSEPVASGAEQDEADEPADDPAGRAADPPSPESATSAPESPDDMPATVSDQPGDGAGTNAEPDAGDAGESLPEDTTPDDSETSVPDSLTAPPASPSPADETQVDGDAQPVAQRIIVGAAEGTQPNDALVLNSLASACLEAAALGIETIELHFNEPREERPLDIASQRLTIRSGPGFEPTITFRPQVEDLSTDRRMIRVGGGQLNWQNIDVRLELPSEPAEAWALFDLQQIESLSVEDSVITIGNAAPDGTYRQDRVAFFEVRSDWLPESDEPPDDGQVPLPPYVGLSNCVARGHGTLIWSAEGTPFRIVCRQSLLIVSQRLIDVGGARAMPGMMGGPIDAVLKNVTAVVGQGAFRLSSDEAAPYQLDFVTDCRNSIFAFANNDAPFIERRGVSSMSELAKRLYARGRDNFYLGTTTLLRINPSGDPAAFIDFSFQDREEVWSQEQNPRFTLMWTSQVPEDLPEDRRTPADYRLADSEQNPAIYAGDESRAGADPDLLPAVPEDAARRDEVPPTPDDPESDAS